jgi:hypothetical protein
MEKSYEASKERGFGRPSLTTSELLGGLWKLLRDLASDGGASWARRFLRDRDQLLTKPTMGRIVLRPRTPDRDHVETRHGDGRHGGMRFGLELVCTGRIKAALDDALPLSQTAEAQRRIAAGAVVGKIALSPRR